MPSFLIARTIRAQMPRTFTLENVAGCPPQQIKQYLDDHLPEYAHIIIRANALDFGSSSWRHRSLARVTDIACQYRRGHPAPSVATPVLYLLPRPYTFATFAYTTTTATTTTATTPTTYYYYYYYYYHLLLLLLLLPLLFWPGAGMHVNSVLRTALRMPVEEWFANAMSCRVIRGAAKFPFLCKDSPEVMSEGRLLAYRVQKTTSDAAAALCVEKKLKWPELSRSCRAQLRAAGVEIPLEPVTLEQQQAHHDLCFSFSVH